MKRLFLMGKIGCGKSTMIRNALGDAASQAGGFVTLRRTEDEKLLGFDLAPAQILVQTQPSYRFLDFSHGVLREDQVFSTYGIPLLQDAKQHSFAIADELGGLELLVDDFYEQLLDFLRSDTPCIGVLKTPEAAKAMAEKIVLGDLYFERYQQLHRMLENDPDTQLLPTAGWQDTAAADTISCWVCRHIRR